MIGPAPHIRGHVPYGPRLLYMLCAVVLPMVPLMSVTFLSARLLYPYYATVPRLWGLSALEDQVTGWLVMSLVDATAYGIALFRLLGHFLADEERVATIREGVPASLRNLPP